MNHRTRRSFVLASAAPFLAGRTAAAEDAHGTALIGVGNRGSYLLKVILQEPRAKVVAVCDTKPDRLDRAASAAARDNPATFSDYRKLLERKEVEAVFIASPCDLHVEMAIAALRAGKHVYCEKPLGVTPEQISRVLRVARQSKTVFMVGHQRRSDERLVQGVARIREGICGKPIMTKAQRHAGNDFAHDGPSADWLFDARRSGDVIVENAIHNLDVCNWAVGSRPERAAGFGGTLLWVNTPPGRTVTDGYTLSYEYVNGVKLSFTQVAFHPSGMPSGGQQTLVYGTRGAVDLESGTYYPLERGAKPQVIAQRDRGNREAKHIGHFLDCIRTGRKPEVDVEVGAIAALTAILGREAYRRGKVVTWKELGVEI